MEETIVKKSLAMIALILLTTACTAQGEPSVDGSEAAKRFVAEVDQETHQVRLPLDQYRASDQEMTINEAALYLNVDLCMGEQGYPVKWMAPEDRYELAEWRRYGRWDMDLAVKFGHHVEGSKAVAELMEWEVKNSEALSSGEAQKASEGCVKAREGIPYISTITDALPAEIQTLSHTSYDHMMASEEAKEVFGDWHACLAQHGLKAGEGDYAFFVNGVSFESVSEEDIQTAVQDVKCREETDFVARLAAIEAAFQAPVIAKYENELVQLRKDIEQAVAESETYIKDNRGRLEKFEN